MPSTATPPPEQNMADSDVDQPMEDTEMQDQEQEEEGFEDFSERFDIDEQRITLLPGGVETAASFQFDGEGHTLGNALRYLIMKNPQVELCAYTIPHPSEHKMNLRIQTDDSTDAFAALEKGLDDLMELCDSVTGTFTQARDQFEANTTNRSQGAVQGTAC